MQELAEAERQANAAERGGSTSNQLDEVMRATLASYDAARLAAVSAPEPTTVAPPPAAATIASAESPSATQDASSDSEAPPAPTDADGAYFGFRNKQDATEAFIKLLRDHSVLSTSNWGDAVKTIHKTALWSQRIRDIPDKEKRQMFNRYKTQRAKEEKVFHKINLYFLFICTLCQPLNIIILFYFNFNSKVCQPLELIMFQLVGRIETARKTS